MRTSARPSARNVSLFTLACLVCLALWTVRGRAATTIVVNSTFDGPVAVDGRCTLREAITAANTDLPSGDCLPGTGADTIKPTSQLPTITQSVTIDGYTQPGASPNTNATGALNTHSRSS